MANAEHIHELVLQRLYHEDLLLTQRTYNFLTFNVFLGALLAFAGVPQHGPNVVVVFIALLGAAISTVQTALGRRIEKAITFWREYTHMIERKEDFAVDPLLFDFYSGGDVHGEVITPWGTIVRKEPRRKAMYRTWPWSWMPSTNTAVGVLLPFLVGTLWLVALTTTLIRSQSYCLVVIPVLYGLGFGIFTFWFPLPATPIAKDRGV